MNTRVLYSLLKLTELYLVSSEELPDPLSRLLGKLGIRNLLDLERYIHKLHLIIAKDRDLEGRVDPKNSDTVFFYAITQAFNLPIYECRTDGNDVFIMLEYGALRINVKPIDRTTFKAKIVVDSEKRISYKTLVEEYLKTFLEDIEKNIEVKLEKGREGFKPSSNGYDNEMWYVINFYADSPVTPLPKSYDEVEIGGDQSIEDAVKKLRHLTAVEYTIRLLASSPDEYLVEADKPVEELVKDIDEAVEKYVKKASKTLGLTCDFRCIPGLTYHTHENEMHVHRYHEIEVRGSLSRIYLFAIGLILVESGKTPDEALKNIKPLIRGRKTRTRPQAIAVQH